MFGITGIMLGSDWRNGASASPPTVDSNIVIFTNSLVDLDSSWLTITQGNNRLIRARNENFADVGVSYGGIGASFTFSTGTAGDHRAEDYNAYANPYEQNYGSGGVISGNSGSHTHGSSTMNFTSSIFPPYRSAYMRKRNPNSSPYFTLPIGTILFGENLDNISDVAGYSTYNGKYLVGQGTSSLTNGGYSNPISYPIATNFAGDHVHNPAPTGGSAVNGYFGGGAETNRAFTDTNYGTSHQHIITANFSIKNKYVKLRPYVTTNSNVFISKGMIFGFVSTINDPDWFCCNGQTARGYTTPNLVDRFIMYGDSSSHNTNPSYVDDVNTVTYLSSTMDTNTWSHSHGVTNSYPAITSLGNTRVIARYHGTASVSHTHSISPVGGVTSYSYEPSHFNLIFYIYLP
jgi:hypothetical protein